MEILKAYQLILDAAEDLRAGGIETKINPSKSERARKEDELPREKWVIIVFHPKDKEQAQIIRKKADELGWSGITFDTSGHPGQRQWEVDWSLKVQDTPDGEWEARGQEVEGMIDGMEGGETPGCHK